MDGQPGFDGSMGEVGGFGKSGSLGGWAVGAQAKELPKDLAFTMPKGSDLILSTHFHPVGKSEEEQSTVGIYLAKKPPTKKFATVLVPPVFGYFSQINIPPNDKSYVVDDELTLPIDVRAFSAFGHAHYLARSMSLVANLPNGTKKTLISIPDWDFNWQEQYQFANDVPLPKGTVLKAHLVYDNTTSNPRNPSNPPKRVTWGEQTTDEMGSMILRLTADDETELPKLNTAIRNHLLELRKKALAAGQND